MVDSSPSNSPPLPCKSKVTRRWETEKLPEPGDVGTYHCWWRFEGGLGFNKNILYPYIAIPGTPRPTSFLMDGYLVISNHFLCNDLVHHPSSVSRYVVQGELRADR